MIERLQQLLTDNVLWVLLAIFAGAVFGVLAAEYAKRFKGVFHSRLSAREYTRKSQFYSTLLGGILANLVAALTVTAPIAVHLLVAVVVFFGAAMLSPELYDLVRRMWPGVEHRVLKKLRGE